MKTIAVPFAFFAVSILTQNSAFAADKQCEAYATGLAKTILQYELKSKVEVKTAEAKVEEGMDAIVETYLFEVSTVRKGIKVQSTPISIDLIRDLGRSNCRMWSYSLPTVN